MTIVGAAASLLIEILRAFVSRQLTDEMKAWMPWVIERTIRNAVSILPESERERFEEEWRSHVNEVPGQWGKLYEACGFFLAARKMTVSLTTRHASASERFSKRAFDRAMVGVFFIFFAPVLVPLVLVLRFTGSGRIFEWRLCVNAKGQTFVRFSFRTPPGKVGHFLRRTGLCDLPQLFNVLRGDMTMTEKVSVRKRGPGGDNGGEE